MNEINEVLLRHGYLLLAVIVFLDQFGLPIPSPAVLLAAGALAATGHMNLGLAVVLAAACAFLSDILRYQIGRRWGGRVLGLLCRISLQPDSCVRRAENTYARLGLRSLLVVKFIPGLNPVAPVLAGLFGMKMGRFLLFGGAGALIWAGVYVGLGYLFSNQLIVLVRTLSRVGVSLVTVMAGALAAYIIWKYIQRRRFLQEIRTSRITPNELNRKLEAGEQTIIIDLRHGLELEAEPRSIPGAVRIPAETLDARYTEIPRDREVVLLCS